MQPIMGKKHIILLRLLKILNLIKEMMVLIRYGFGNTDIHLHID